MLCNHITNGKNAYYKNLERMICMGTFLYEYVEEHPFEEPELLLEQLKEVLHDFGECRLEQIELFGRKIVFMNQNDFSRSKKNEELVILAYNRLEHDKWEPSFLELNPDKFTGIRSWAIGSKVGYLQHYDAMAVARVLCECYSNGKYIVYGNINSTVIFMALAYIWEKYGFELVERFIDNRLDAHTIVKNLDTADCYLGTRGLTFYIETFFKSDLKKWFIYMENEHCDDEDLALCERGEKPKYFCTYAYLGIKLLFEAIKEKIDIENPDLDIQKLIDIFRFYSLDMYYHRSDVKELFTTNRLPEELIRYEKFFENYLKYVTLTKCYIDPEIVLKIIEETIQEKNKEHAQDIIKEFRTKLQDIYTNFEDFAAKPDKTPGEAFAFALAISGGEPEFEKIRIIEDKKIIIDNIKKIIDEKNSIDKYFADSEQLNELLRAHDTVFSPELEEYLKGIFSLEKFQCFKNEQEKYKASEDFTENFLCLSDIADKIYQEDQLLLTKNLVYELLDTFRQNTGKLRLELLHFFVNNSSGNDREAILWVIGDNELYKKYVLKSWEKFEKNTSVSDSLESSK